MSVWSVPLREAPVVPDGARCLVPIIILNPRLDEFLKELDDGVAVVHPMFKNLHCVVMGYEVQLRFKHYTIVLLAISDFVIDDGKG